jgi:hypothetical protein
VKEAALHLHVSESWVRRHIAELPAVRAGRLVRFDSLLLNQQFKGKSLSETSGIRFSASTSAGRSLKPGRSVMPRYQRGSVYQAGRKQKVWYGMFREDLQKPDGRVERRQRNIRLGILSELPTKNAARQRLSELMRLSQEPSTEMTFEELVQKWQTAVVPTLKLTTASYYQKNLRRHLIPAFGNRQISDISRYDVETLLAEQATKYCRNTLRGMRISLSRVLSWAVACEWLEKNICSGIKLPRAGKRIVRTVLKPEQVVAIAGALREPYATLVLFLAVTGLRIGEAVAIKWSDFDGDVLHISRRSTKARWTPPSLKILLGVCLSRQVY